MHAKERTVWSYGEAKRIRILIEKYTYIIEINISLKSLDTIRFDRPDWQSVRRCLRPPWFGHSVGHVLDRLIWLKIERWKREGSSSHLEKKSWQLSLFDLYRIWSIVTLISNNLTLQYSIENTFFKMV